MLKQHSTNGAINPSDPSFDCFKAVEFHPDSLPHSGTFDKLDFAAFRRNVEETDTKTVNTRTSDESLSGNSLARRSLRLRHSPVYHADAARVTDVGCNFAASVSDPKRTLGLAGALMRSQSHSDGRECHSC